MPKIELTTNELIVRLKLWESILSFQKSIHIPLKNVRGATDDDGFSGWKLGIRSPGTGIPGIISAGTYLKSGDWQFVFVTRGTHRVVIELNHNKYKRLIVGVKNARELVVEINAAIEQV